MFGDIQVTSKDVFAKRKQGQLDEAYQMALKITGEHNQDEWNTKALAWCLIDLIKRESANNNMDLLQKYIRELQAIKISPSDEVLTKQANFAFQLVNPNSRQIQQAKTLGKNGQHQQAINLYRQLLQSDPNNTDLLNGIGWEFYRLAKLQFINEKINVFAVKKQLSDYLNLNCEKPSLLHSLILGLADKLIGEGNFNLVAFIKIWGIENLRDEDFEGYTDPNTFKSYSSLAEKVIRHTSKQAIDQNDASILVNLLPLIEKVLPLAEDPIWFNLYKARALNCLGHYQEAFNVALGVTKQKVGDYWAWELLGDIQLNIDPKNAHSCYCKALSLGPKEDFIGKLRLKLANQFISNAQYAEAKQEIETLIKAKLAEQHKVPEEALSVQNLPWFSDTVAVKNNEQYYQSNIELAQELLFSDLPWLNSCVGHTFTLKDQPHKKKRIIYISLVSSENPIEISVPENRYNFSKIASNSSIKVKGELTNDGRFSLYQIDSRMVEAEWDIFPEQVAVIDHVNAEKKVAHIVISKGIDSVIPLNELPLSSELGNCVGVRISKSRNKHGMKYRTVNVHATSKKASSLVLKEFTEKVRISNGLGFTDNDIFIDRPLVTKCKLQEDQMVTGRAVINYNKKRGTWGWKALDISPLQQAQQAPPQYNEPSMDFDDDVPF